MYEMDKDELLEAAARLTPQWLAGFFDGEGWVSAYKANSSYQVTVGVGQADPRILSLVALRFGVGISERSTKGHIHYNLRLHGKMALPFLHFIKDHVICKRRQVEAAIKMAGEMRHTSGGSGGLTDSEIALRAELAETIRRANHEVCTKANSQSGKESFR